MSARLQKIVSAIPRCSVLADVGCDHGYVGIAALKSGVCKKVTFVDISPACLKKARENCPESLKSCASFVCRDGLGDIECDCAVIAGMGGLEIISVLNGAKSLPNILVLQPMRNQPDVRRYISAIYEIISDEKFSDGKFYDLIVAKKNLSGGDLSEDELLFGRTNLIAPSRDFVDFLTLEKNKLTKILQGCADSEVKEKLGKVCEVLASLKEKKL